jgi:hypothetical protein
MTTNDKSLDSAAVMLRLQEIEQDLATRQNEFENAAADRARLVRDWEHRLAVARKQASGNDADARKAAALVMAISQDDLYERLSEAESQFEALRAATRVLEVRASIGQSILRGLGRG